MTGCLQSVTGTSRACAHKPSTSRVLHVKATIDETAHGRREFARGQSRRAHAVVGKCLRGKAMQIDARERGFVGWQFLREQCSDQSAEHVAGAACRETG